MNFILKLFLFLFLFSSTQAFSRAGGGGGKSHSSSSSHHSSSSSFSHHSSGNGTQAPPWVVKIVIGVVIAIVIFFTVVIFKAIRYSKKQGSGSKDNPSKPVIAEEFFKSNPGFNTDAFKAKVKTAFMAIQKAWQEQDLSKVRNWISDGVYQRFCLQFDMMKQLGQKNILSHISITDIEFIKASTEGSYSIVTVTVCFKMDDEFISEKLPELNESFNAEEAMEYWTFIKKSGAITKNLYKDNSCPNCGNDLNQNGGEISKCPSCGTVTYLGDYDWVLCEITQEDDYDEEGSDTDIPEKLKTEKDFCIQNMEDKASNAFVHYLFASAWNKPEHFNRFATDDVLTELKKENDEPYIYNRIYLNSVTYSDYELTENTHHLNFTVVYSSQKVKLANGKVQKLDDDIEIRYGNVILSRSVDAKRKSVLWGHECANCGAPYDDTTNTSCSYCHEKINSVKHDWIVTEITEE